MTKFKHISDLKSFDDIAKFMEVSKTHLWEILIRDKNSNYTQFTIPKKNGTPRTIYKPIDELKQLQNKLKDLLEQSFTPHHRAHGFIKKRDFITNASKHVDKKFVFNLDLENFFETISFRRVRHMFIAYFKLDANVSSTLANICCHFEGFLPQGAPTSPVISNIICKTLDKQFMVLAKSCKLTYYTRYADDITFSSNDNIFPNRLATVDTYNIIKLSNVVTNIIHENGFRVNYDKVRLQNSGDNQEVTGITVNKKVNINRRYIKNIRAIIHSFKFNHNNPDVPLDLFKQKYNSNQSKPLINNLTHAFNVIKGRLLHVAHIRGVNDTVYMNLASDFNQMIECYNLSKPKIRLPSTKEEILIKNTFVIELLDSSDDVFFIKEDGNTDDLSYGQGTGFYLKDIGLITNYHVIEYLITEVLQNELKFCKKFYIEYYSDNKGSQTKFRAKIKYYSKEMDIVILEPEYTCYLNEGLVPCTNYSDKESITLAGFPEHEKGSNLRIVDGEITRVRNPYSTMDFEISPNIFSGNSGGPVINSDNEVIGIASKGFSNGIVPSECISIENVINLYNINNKKPD